MYCSIVIPYIDKLLISNSQRPKYYSIKNKRGRKYVSQDKFPSIWKKIEGGEFIIDNDGFIIDAVTKEKQVSNVRTVGTPKYWVINFQDLYNGNVDTFSRNTKMNQLKEQLWNSMKDKGYNQYNIKPEILNYPIKIELFIYAPEMPVDVDNKGVLYHKAFQDLIKSVSIIPDDSSEYINDTGRTKWVRSERNEMEFVISESI